MKTYLQRIKTAIRTVEVDEAMLAIESIIRERDKEVANHRVIEGIESSNGALYVIQKRMEETL